MLYFGSTMLIRIVQIAIAQLVLNLTYLIFLFVPLLTKIMK